MREPTNEQMEFQFESSVEPCSRVKYLMEIGGFRSIDEYYVWIREPLGDREEPDWAESAFREMGCLDEDEDDDPAILEYMTDYENAHLQEKEDRLIRAHNARQVGGTSTWPLR